MQRSHSTQAQSTASHCRLTSPTGEWLFHGCTVRSPLTGCRATSRPRDRFSRYLKRLDTFRTRPRIRRITVNSAAIRLVHRSCLIFHLSAKSWRTAVMGNSCHWTAPNVVSCCLLLNLNLLLSRSLSEDTLFGWCLLYITVECTKCMAIYFLINFVTKSDRVSYSMMWIM